MRHLILRESGGQVMDQNERHMIDDLFDRLRKADEQAEPRDPDAEALIARHVARQPAASYYMAQTIVVQQEALGRAQTKFQELERRLAERRSGGFLSGLFGGEEAATSGAPARGERTPGAFGRYHQPAPGGGFLAGAMQTALGVAGPRPARMMPRWPRRTSGPRRRTRTRRERPAGTLISAASTSSSWLDFLAGRHARKGRCVGALGESAGSAPSSRIVSAAATPGPGR